MNEITLKEQIFRITVTRINLSFAEMFETPKQIDALVHEAFLRQWGDHWETRAVRKAAQLMEDPGYFSDDEPGVPI